MSERSKNKILKGYNAVLLLLAAVFLIVSFLPVVVIDANRAEYPEVYYEGRFTSEMSPISEVKLGYNVLFSLVFNWNDMNTIRRIQANEAYVGNESELMEELIDREASEEEIEELREDIADARETLAEDLEALTEEDYERIMDKLQNDDGFRNLIGGLYSFVGSIDDEDADAAGDTIVASDGEMGFNPVPLVYGIFSVSLSVSLVLVALIYPIVLLVKLIPQLIFFFKHLRDDPSVTEKYTEKFPMPKFCTNLLIFFVFYSLFAPKGLSAGACIIACLILWLVSNLIRGVKHVLLNESNKPLAWAKEGVTCVSIVIVLLLLVNFSGLGLVGGLEDSIDTMTYKHYMAELDELSEENMDMEEREEAAKSAVTLSNGINTGVVLLLVFCGLILCIAMANNGIERLGYKQMKLRTGDSVPYKAMRSMAITLLVFVLLPAVLFTAGSGEALEDAYDAGNFKVWYDAYQEDGTPENGEYELLRESRDRLEEVVEELKDEDELKAAESLLASIEDEIDAIEGRSAKRILCIVFAVILVLVEFVYHFLPKFFPEITKKEPVAEVGMSEETFAAPAVPSVPEEPSGEQAPEEPAPAAE